MTNCFKETQPVPAKSSRAVWTPAMVDDLVDIVVTNDYYVKKLVKEVTNSSTNGVYSNILEELKQRHKIDFTVEQIRTKFKFCVKTVNKVNDHELLLSPEFYCN